MKKVSSLLIIVLISSCSSIGKFGAGVDITFDPRTIGMQIEDTIMQKNLSARLALTNKKYFLSIQSEVIDGRIFLSGKVKEPEEKISGNYVITKVTHLLEKSRGYTQAVEMCKDSFRSNVRNPHKNVVSTRKGAKRL